MSKKPSSPSSASPQKLKIAIIGAGGISEIHAKSIKACPDLEMVGSCDIVKERAEKAAAERGGRAYTDPEKMLDVEKPDLVMLCTPQMVRLEPIRICAERGVPLFIEKPPADNLENAKKIEEILKKHPIIHSVGFMYRYLKTVERAMEILKGRTLQMIRQVFLCTPLLPGTFENMPGFFFKKELSGGIVGDQAIHLLDLVRYATGSEVAEVQGFGNNLLRPKSEAVTTDETITLNLRTESQVVISHAHSWAYPYSNEVEYFATGAHLKLDLGGGLRGEVDGMKIEYRPEDNAYLNELRAMAEAVRQKSMKPIRSTYSDAVKSFAMTVALNRSLETGERIKI